MKQRALGGGDLGRTRKTTSGSTAVTTVINITLKYKGLKTTVLK